MGRTHPFSSFEATEQFDSVVSVLDARRQKQVAKAVLLLMTSPSHPGLQCHPIKPDKYYWEAYVNKGDRIVYVPEGDHLVLINVIKHDHIDRYGRAPKQG